MNDKVGKQFSRENLNSQERLHQGLVGSFPFVAMRFYLLAIFLNSYQVCDLVDEGHKKAIFVQIGIDCNLMLSVGQALVIPMPTLSLIDDLKVDS